MISGKTVFGIFDSHSCDQNGKAIALCFQNFDSKMKYLHQNYANPNTLDLKGILLSKICKNAQNECFFCGRLLA
jgi:hypothetical protein